jgi:hypothetical protein
MGKTIGKPEKHGEIMSFLGENDGNIIYINGNNVGKTMP